MVAMRRAAHQIFDQPKVFDDPLAMRILGSGAEERLRSESRFVNRLGRVVRAAMAARSRYAEDQLAQAVERGTRQYVVLGAGLDTFACRNPHRRQGLRVFEVDHPATQEWKRQRLAAAGIAIPECVTFAAIDFECQTLAEGLHRAGFDMAQPAFFSCLGVTMYLARETVMGTLRFIALGARGGGVALDYLVPPDTLSWTAQLIYSALSRRVAKAGEPFQTFFAPDSLRAELVDMGFRFVENLGASEINSRYFADRSDGLRVPGLLGRFMSAQV
jgi:methyltransferase (TIGR00027 family)